MLFALLGKFAKQVLWGPPSPITSSYADMHTIVTVLLHVYTVSLYIETQTETQAISQKMNMYHKSTNKYKPIHRINISYQF